MGKLIENFKIGFIRKPLRFILTLLLIFGYQKCKLHIVGSIHMGTENMFPLSATLLDKLNFADALIVEADITETSPHFLMMQQNIFLSSSG